MRPTYHVSRERNSTGAHQSLTVFWYSRVMSCVWTSHSRHRSASAQTKIASRWHARRRNQAEPGLSASGNGRRQWFANLSGGNTIDIVVRRSDTAIVHLSISHRLFYCRRTSPVSAEWATACNASSAPEPLTADGALGYNRHPDGGARLSFALGLASADNWDFANIEDVRTAKHRQPIRLALQAE